MKQSDIVVYLGAAMTLMGIVAEVWEKGLLGVVPTNFEMILLGFIVLLLALIMKMTGYEGESIVTHETRSEEDQQ